MECKQCKSLCIKKGFQKNRKQKFYCKNCSLYQQQNYVYIACKTSLKSDIIKMVKRSCGIRDIAHIKGVSTTTVIKEIRSIAGEITSPANFPFHSDYEMDEMYTCIWVDNRKNGVYIAYAINKKNKSVVDFTVGRRDSKTLSKTIGKILLNYPKSIRTDKWCSYAAIIPEDIHIKSRRKINQIERKNYTMRTQLKRLGHNPICQSKKKDMLIACLKIYFWG
ncbi:MAG: IS1 family transposase [Bacteroidia bacterium]